MMVNKLTPIRHSREGGSPSLTLTMDSRLRGNDDVMVIG
jgi:hypothetical protein